MPTVILARHGRTTANATGVLAGRTPGVGLDEVGEGQARRAGDRVAALDWARVLVSPQPRCAQTAALILGQRDPARPAVAPTTAPGLDECDYGTWQGGRIADLVEEPLWRTVQAQPSAARFPEGESLGEMSHRAVATIRDQVAALQLSAHEAGGLVLAVSHGDVIKAILADALGMHLDQFQRIRVDPGSLSVVSYGPERAEVLTANSTAGDLAWLASPSSRPDPAATTTVPGGGAGHE